MGATMIHTILAWLAGIIINAISELGYAGVALLMAIESANIPLPSEIIMPFSGYLAYTGQFTIFWAGFSGAIGCVIGSIASWAIGYWGGRPLLDKFGKYILISHRDLDRAEFWFKKRGELTVFVGRLLPIIRTYISLPAGIAKMSVWKMSIYTFLGSLPWCIALAWIGKKAGENWDTLGKYFHGFDWAILILIIFGITWWIWRHLKERKND